MKNNGHSHRNGTTHGPSGRPPGGVVIGGDYQGLGIVRSLGRRGVPVCVIDDEWSISRYSKYLTHGVKVKGLENEEVLIDTLLKCARRFNLKGWVLYPTRDELVAAISRHRDVLQEYYRVPTPAWETVKWAWDKRNTYARAAKLGIDIPKTWYPGSEENLDELEGHFPLIIKPAVKERFLAATKAKAWMAENLTELKQKFRKAAAIIPASEIMIQEFISGGCGQQFGFSAFFKDGKARLKMLTHNSRSHPPQFGRSSTFVETVDVPQLVEKAEHFLRDINYYGLVETEFRLDPKTGVYKLLDVNARTWGYHSLGAAAGVDFAYSLFEDQMGRDVEANSARLGCVWVRLVTDLPVGVHGTVLRHWSPFAYMKSLGRANTEAVFSWRDPLPGLVELALVPYLAVRRGY